MPHTPPPGSGQDTTPPTLGGPRPGIQLPEESVSQRLPVQSCSCVSSHPQNWDLGHPGMTLLRPGERRLKHWLEQVSLGLTGHPCLDPGWGGVMLMEPGSGWDGLAPLSSHSTSLPGIRSF